MPSRSWVMGLPSSVVAAFSQCLFAMMLRNSFVNATDQCKMIDTCSCKFDDGRKISLRPLDRSGSPRFSFSSSTGTFQYNPCTPFTVAEPRGQCVNVLACQSGLIGSSPIALAYKNSTTSTYNSKKGKYEFIYTGGIESGNRRYKSILVLNCDKKDDNPTITFKFASQGTYEATLTSKYACPSSVLSTGSILCIVFFSLLLGYLVFGVLVNKFALHKEGSDVIPQKSFWQRLPGLAKDGCVYTFRKIRGKEGQYEKL